MGDGGVDVFGVFQDAFQKIQQSAHEVIAGKVDKIVEGGKGLSQNVNFSNLDFVGEIFFQHNLALFRSETNTRAKGKKLKKLPMLPRSTVLDWILSKQSMVSWAKVLEILTILRWSTRKF